MPRLAEHALDGLEHPARLEGLHDEVLRARLDRLDDQRLLSHRAAHQDLRPRVELRDLADGVVVLVDIHTLVTQVLL